MNNKVVKVIYFVLFFVLIQLVPLWLLCFKLVGTGQILWRGLLSLAYVGSFLGILWWLKKIVAGQRTTPVWRPLKKQDWRLVGGGFVAVWVVNYGLGLLNQLMFKQDQTANTQTINTLLESDRWVFYLLIFSAIFLSPLVEELLFRGFLFNAFFRADQLWWAVVASGLLFSLAHASNNPISFLIYGCMGAIFMWIYRRTDNLATSIALHGVNNLLAMAATVALMH